MSPNKFSLIYTYIYYSFCFHFTTHDWIITYMSLHTYITCIVCNLDALKVIQKSREYPDYFIPILEPLGHMQSIPRTLYIYAY